MTFSFRPVPVTGSCWQKPFVRWSGGARQDTRREEDAERPLQSGVPLRMPTTVLHAKETSHAKSEPC
jgi:hypothetical protein